METKQKSCKGTGKASGFGCGVVSYLKRYGLCQSCYPKWLYSTPGGAYVIKKAHILSARKDVRLRKEQIKSDKESIKSKSYWEGKLQSEINCLVRLIDFDKSCISCNHGINNWTRQSQAGHRFSRGAFPAIRFNVWNIFRQCSVCNNYLSGNETEYDKGLKKAYGIHCFNYIHSLPLKYTTVKLSVFELQEAIKTARAIKKRILKGDVFTRDEINGEIGIY